MTTSRSSRRIATPAGDLDLVAVSPEKLEGSAFYWPAGPVVEMPDLGGASGLVFQIGDEEVWGLKLQPPDGEVAIVGVIHQLNRLLIASALPRYLERRHRGVMVPCAYFKQKPSGLYESGFAFFVGPDAASSSRRRRDGYPAAELKLGAGASAMVSDMVDALREAAERQGWSFGPFIGLDLRPRLAIGGLAMHFLLEGPRVVVVKWPLDEDEPIWEWLVRAGFARLEYAPMVPVALPGPDAEDAHEDLGLAELS